MYGFIKANLSSNAYAKNGRYSGSDLFRAFTR